MVCIAFGSLWKLLDYYPVSNTTLWLEWRLWGSDPAPYRISNLILHVASALLLWMILAKLGITGAYFAALLFAVHPLNVEAVAWIAQRKDVLALFFFLLSVLWYLCAERSASEASPAALPLERGNSGLRQYNGASLNWRRAGWYSLSLLAFLLGMLSKGSIAVLPLVLLLIAWWKHSTLTSQDILRLAPFFCIAAALTLVHIWSQTHGSGEILRHATIGQRALGAATAIWFYLAKAILPLDLLFVYPQWSIDIIDWRWWLPLLAVLTVTAILWRCAQAPSSRWIHSLAFAWAFFCVALVPVLGFADTGFMQYSLIADHYAHLALIAVVAILAAGWSIWRRSAKHRWLPIAAAVLVAIIFTYLTWHQNRLYETETTLYKTVLAQSQELVCLRPARQGARSRRRFTRSNLPVQ